VIVSHGTVDQAVFLTWVYSKRQRWCARLLIDSIRAFGGALRHCPIWVFEANPTQVSCASLETTGVHVQPLSVPETARHYLFAHKVYACARAEELAPPGVRSLIWLGPECLIIQPPLLFDLGQSFDAAVRPVHIQNVGLSPSQPLDGFWKGVYEVVGIDDVQTTVESFVDQRHLRAYFNSASFAVNPSAGLFRRWFDCFEALVCDEEYQLAACQDQRHQIFLHQAIWSSLIVTMLDRARIRMLPPEYGYPYNLHRSVPPDRRARAANDLVCAIYEERSVDPADMDDIEVHDPLKLWLSAHAAISRI
jgi:hypothetical protein